ncbi:PAS domain S-box protein [Vitiosangium sp. GDMCC 1.1324]|uniref:sensor histidine kinase n=1 Tax=Vitiosangium sp. (strain GDMCC 1.1324) TaxID=2138576 RepID=UPI000D3AEF12|nr:PAS domain S-box protein [Vitiosangium sp. GDMCC 1.1324]PTL82070.1 PAS domain-containing sensor histidine kinase [Vitiosangium sp. GDMCC 1.1324]
MTAQSPSPSPPDELAEGLFQVQHHALLRAILDNLSEGVIVADARGHLLYFSPKAQTLSGLGLTDASPEAWSEKYGVFHPDMRTRCPTEKLPLYRALRGEQEPEEELFIRNPQAPEGRHIHSSARPVRDIQGTLLGAIVSMRDIHRQRQAEAERHLTEQRFRLIVEAAQEGIWTLDTDNRTTYVNHYLAEMLGYTVDEMMGRHVHEFMDEERRQRVTQNLEKRRQGQGGVVDFQLLRKDGQPVWTMLSSNPMYDEEGRYVGALAMVTDITQRRAAEEQVRQLNAQLEQRIAERTAQLEFSNRELEAFAYSVAHDLRAPLRSISNFTLALTEDCSAQLDDTGQDYLKRIRASAQRMSELIDGILALSRVNRTEFVQAEVNLSALARSIAEQLQRWQPQRTVRFRIQDGLVDRGDSQLLRSVLENLLGNAWKFTRERAIAEIEFGTTLLEDGKQRVYFVRDNGAGFDMAFREKLFGVFQRLHTQQEFEGNGVGLATVQRILRRHGGRIWGEGLVGHGASFSFTLHETTTPPAVEPGPNT